MKKNRQVTLTVLFFFASQTHKASIFVKSVENRFDEATQKFRQLDGVKLHRPIPPPQAEPLPASSVEAATDYNVCACGFVLCQTSIKMGGYLRSPYPRNEAMAAARSA